MDNVPKHTPTPWIVRNLLSVEAQTDGKAIAICVPCPKDGNMARINAAFIVETCNTHAALIEENESLRKALIAAKAAIKGREHTGFIDAALSPQPTKDEI